MGARPSSFKKGGGFLNNVDGMLADYEFTDVFPFGDGDQKRSKGDFNPLYFVLTVNVDGNDEEQKTTLFVGSADDFEISEDGKTITPVDEKIGLRDGSDFANFIATLCAAGFPETSLPDDDEPINYEAIIGTRVTLRQDKDEVAMQKAAKNYKQSKGKFNEQGQRKGKDGKYYNQTRLVVADVLALPGAAGKTTPAKDGKAVKSAPAGKAKKTKGIDIETLADETLLAILSDEDGSIVRSKLPNKIHVKLGAKHPQREDLRKLIASEDYLKGERGWTYDKKSQVVAVAEEE